MNNTSPLWVGAKSVLYPGVSRRIYVPGGSTWWLLDTGGSGNIAREELQSMRGRFIPSLFLDNGSRSVTQDDGYVVSDRRPSVYPSAYPFTMAVAFRLASGASADYCGVGCLGAYGSLGTDYGAWLYLGNPGSGYYWHLYHAPSGWTDVGSFSAPSENVWYLAVIVWRSATSRTLTVYNLDTGALHGSDTYTTSVTWGIAEIENRAFSVGADLNYWSATPQYWDYLYGHVAFGAVWHRALDVAEVAALGCGAWMSALDAPRVLHFPPTFRRVLPGRGR